MEDDDVPPEPVVTSAGQLRESRCVASEQVISSARTNIAAKGSFGKRSQPGLKPTLAGGRQPSIEDTVAEVFGGENRELSVEGMFKALDVDKSGGLDVIELRGFVELLGIKMTEDQITAMLQAKLGHKLMEGEELELNFEGFKEFMGPILKGLKQEEEKAEAEVEALAAAPGGLPPGSFEPSSLGFLTLENPARVAIIRLVTTQAFDYFVLLLIGCNAVMMAMEDPLRDPDNPTPLEEQMKALELVFNVIFTIEMTLKIVALGFASGAHTYLQDGWNILDAVVVLTAWLPYILPDSASKGGAVRAFRLLRPLRTINRFPGLKRLVTTILMSIPQMQVLAIMVLIYVFTFAVIAVQLWQGIMLQRCAVSIDSRAIDRCVVSEGGLCVEQQTMLIGDDSAFCDMASTGKALPWEGKTCPQAGDNCTMHDVNPYGGVLNFDNFLDACIPVFQMATVSSWQEVMHITQDTTGEFATIYFIFGTVFGGYFLFNLFVAVLKSKFEIAMAVAAEGKDIFEMVDVDGDGELDINELDMILKNKGVFMTQEKLEELFVKVDLDKGGTIDMEEFTTWLRSDDVLAAQLRERMDVGKSRAVSSHLMEETNFELPKVDQIRMKLRLFEPDNDWGNLFEYYDMDGDARMGMDEFTTLLRRDIGMRVHQITDEEIKETFDDIDTKKTGDVDADEFGAWVVLETIESQWVKVRAALKEKGWAGLSQLVLDKLAENAKPPPPEFAQGVAAAENFDNEIIKKIAGSEYPPWQENLRTVLRSKLFQIIVCVLVASNTVVLALDHHGIDPDLEANLGRVNVALTVLFVFEILAKMVAYNWDEFFDASGSHLDFFMALAGLVDLLAGLAGLSELPGVNDMFIIVRVLRPLRLIWTIPTLEPVYHVVIKTFAGLVYIASLAGLFMFIFSVLGMQIFGGKFDQFDPKPRSHYDTFPMALATTFQVMTFDSWQVVMYDGIRAVGGASALFFVAWVVVGSMVMLNLLLVIILDVFTQVVHDDPDAYLEADADADEEFSNPLKNSMMSTTDLTAFEVEVQGDESDDEFVDMNSGQFDKSCGIFTTDNSIRKVCMKIAESNTTDKVILLLIVANCVTMAMDHPGVDPESDKRMILDVIDIFFTIAFTVEMCVRVVAIGFFKDQDSYLRGWWNRLDFAIVIVSWLDYLAAALDIKFLKTLRLLRALRALRMFNRLTGLKVLIDSLLESIAALSTIFAVTMIVFLAYSILGVTAFKGRFHRCTDDVGVAGIDSCIGTYVAAGAIESNMWVRPHSNFDNVLHGMFTLFTVSTSNDWIITAQLAVDAPEFVDQQPIRENAPYRVGYFMLFIIVVNFFFLNLFIGVIYGKYVEFATAGLKELSKDQRHWLDILRQLAYADPQKDMAMMVKEQQAAKQGPSLGIKEKVFNLVDRPMFDHFIVVCIIANCIMMAATYRGEPQEWTDMQALLNFVFALIFTVEMFLKMTAFGFSVYFNDSWCRFDCFVVTGSWADLIFTWLGISLFSSSLFRIIRISRVIGRIGRVFKLLGDSKSTLGLDEVMECLYQALPQLGYIGILVGLILFIFAVLAMNLFGNLAQTGCIGPNTNFERAPIAALTLLGVATKDRITCTIHAAMVQEPYCSEADGTCGTPVLPQLFFIMFSLVIMFTTLEMFVNVVLQSFEDLSSAAGLPLTLAHIKQFEQSWKKFDPRATGWIAQKDLKALFDDLPPEVGLDQLAGEHEFDPRVLRLIELPNGDPSKHLLGLTATDVKECFTDDGVVDRILRIADFVFGGAEIDLKGGLPDKDKDSGSITFSADKLHDRLEEVSGLTRAEVGAIVRQLDSDEAAADTELDNDGQVDRQEFESGLTKLNEARLAGNIPEGRANESMLKLIMGQLQFHEVLYSICERKTGKPLPNTNYACREARIKMGVRMPSIKHQVFADIYQSADALRATPVMHAALAKGIKPSDAEDTAMIYDLSQKK